MYSVLRLAGRGTAVLALSLLFMHPVARAHGESPPVSRQTSHTTTHAMQATRLERLAALAKLWGEIKYFHPYLAYKDIDWDRALVETIPLVNAATTPHDYKAAIDHLLGFLGDEGTYTEWETVDPVDAVPPLGKIDMKDCIQLDNGMLRVQVARLGEAVDQQGSMVAVNEAVGMVTRSLTGVKSLVLDVRSDRDLAGGIGPRFYPAMFAALIEHLSDQPVTLGALRYRMHHGYATQDSNDVQGSYFSSLIQEKPVLIIGESPVPPLPTVVLVNQHSPVSDEILSGLQSTGRAQIIAEGKDTDFLPDATVEMTDGLRVKLRTLELVMPDGSIGMKADQVEPANRIEASIAPALDRLRGQHTAIRASQTPQPTGLIGNNDDAYPKMHYPATEYRLLALFRFWNVIEYFSPYRDLMGPSWDDVLIRYIPQFEADQDALAYKLTLAQLVTETHDSHGYLLGDNQASTARFGLFQPPVHVGLIEGRTVVLKLLEEGTGLHVGDTIATVDGLPVAQRRADLARYIAASTPQALERDVSRYLLRGAKDSKITLGVRGADGSLREARLVRTLSREDPKVIYAQDRSTPVFRVLPDGFGYVDLGRLEPADVDRMFETIKSTSATIFDMRGFPNDTAWSIAPRLTRKTNVIAALFSWPVQDGKNLGDEESGDAAYTSAVRLPKAHGDPYLGKVVMLIDENAQSQGEHTCLFFEAATKVTFIGTPTAGADGTVTKIAIPGNMTILFTGLGVRHADGRQLQRLGIQPDIRVAPTVQGIAAGKDEILTAAMGYLEKTAPPSH